jgi:Tfp pilus assembly protein PilN
MRGRLITHKINVSDFDEALLSELEGVDDVSGDFWEEVAIRLSEAIKQSLAFISESYDFPKLDKLYLVSEYKVIDNLTHLLEDRLGHVRINAYDAMEDVDVPSEHARFVDYFSNPSVFTTAVGLATQGLNVEGKDVTHQHQRLISMNFLDEAPRIRRNRQLASLNRILSLAIMAVVLVSGGLLGFNTIPTFLQTRDAVQKYEVAQASAQTQSLRRQVNEKKLAAANEVTFKIQNNSLSRGHADFLEALPSLIPANAELENLRIEENKPVQLSGVATSNNVISDIKNNLRSARFTRRDPSVTTERDGELWRFTMDINLARVE